MEVLYNLPALYLLAINIATFSAFGADKRRARRESWRIPEKTLFLLSLLGGSAGALLGMRIFHHKTRKWYFRFGIPLLLILQGAALCCFAAFAAGLFAPVFFRFLLTQPFGYAIISRLTFSCHICRCSTTARAPAFQAGDVGSIPITCSICACSSVG